MISILRKYWLRTNIYIIRLVQAIVVVCWLPCEIISELELLEFEEINIENSCILSMRLRPHNIISFGMIFVCNEIKLDSISERNFFIKKKEVNKYLFSLHLSLFLQNHLRYKHIDGMRTAR